ncbi:uncharacterized protein LOC131001114 isoform X3 [Salvia miltiorrhiza]|uniref:uncharacterized protein LOC131001114 isoform X3 n=1 Tax=Salvia miltiorrhiza TaxID=226208 RepID=UPI0025AC5E49|nr:uncharacterized protein LOC131001114 isoform X3 [Salvia miltiorrhiza]XP_057783335.1 uncharacterized protein LOC131001114 isoform X3 [Salvia miltiorrhiza]
MGNQNASGIVEEEAKNEAPDNAQGISPPDAVAVEKQTVVQENAAEADKIPPVEIHKADVEDRKESDAVMDISTNGSDLGEGRSELSDEEPCTLTAVNTTSDIQEEQTVLVKEVLEVDDDANKNEQYLALASPQDTVLQVREEALGRDDDYEPPQEEQSNSFTTANEAPRTSLVGSSTSQNECLTLDHEEKPMIHELGNGDEQSDQENNQFLIRCSSNPMEVIKAEFEENVDDAEKQQDNELTDQDVVEKAIDLESDASDTENVHETTDKCVIELQSSTEIDTQRLCNKTAPILNSTQPIRAQVELRKSPSFDFGISFDTRSQESDQTPLLYQDKTARRSLSTCSNLGFQNTSVEAEYVEKTLQFQAVQVEEKTIRMERSNSESSQENANAVTHSNASPSTDADAISPKRNGRRKARSSLFTTCICCTAAIS